MDKDFGNACKWTFGSLAIALVLILQKMRLAYGHFYS